MTQRPVVQEENGCPLTATVPSPLMSTSSQTGVNCATTGSTSSSTVIVHVGAVPSHSGRLQPTNFEATFGSGSPDCGPVTPSVVAVNLTVDPMGRLTMHPLAKSALPQLSAEPSSIVIFPYPLGIR